MAQHEYEVVSVPPGCTTFEVGDTMVKTVPTPPPQTITLQNLGPCSGTVLQLVE